MDINGLVLWVHYKPIAFDYEDLKVRVHLFLFTDDRAWTSDYYRRYWMDDPRAIVESI